MTRCPAYRYGFVRTAALVLSLAAASFAALALITLLALS